MLICRALNETMSEVESCPFVPPLEKTEKKQKRAPKVKTEKVKVVRPLSDYQIHMQKYFEANKGKGAPRELFKAGIAEWNELKKANWKALKEAHQNQAAQILVDLTVPCESKTC